MNMIFTIFAFVFLGTLLLFNNNVIVNSLALASENEVSIIAFSEAQSVIDEAKMKAFDENTISVVVPDSTSFSATLGREGETFPSPLDTSSSTGYRSSVNFDDVDDYTGYTRLVKTSSSIGKGDTVSADVRYVAAANPDSVVSGKTYFKKMTVTVKSPYLNQPYSISYVFTY